MSKDNVGWTAGGFALPNLQPHAPGLLLPPAAARHRRRPGMPAAPPLLPLQLLKAIISDVKQFDKDELLDVYESEAGGQQGGLGILQQLPALPTNISLPAGAHRLPPFSPRCALQPC